MCLRFDDPGTLPNIIDQLMTQSDVIAHNLIAVRAISYWARGLKGIVKTVENDDFWRSVA
jgi:hypothetical protein